MMLLSSSSNTEMVCACWSYKVCGLTMVKTLPVLLAALVVPAVLVVMTVPAVLTVPAVPAVLVVMTVPAVLTVLAVLAIPADCADCVSVGMRLASIERC